MNYWQRPRRTYSARSGSQLFERRVGTVNTPLYPSGHVEGHRERWHRAKARCPKCGRWRFMRLLSDTWQGQRKVRLQCECGYCFTHDAYRDDHLLVRTSGSGTRGTYKPLGYRRYEADERTYSG